MELRDYQIKAIEDVHNAWKRGKRRPCVVLPCGAGKTVIAAELAKRTAANGKRVLCLVHRQELCEQMFNAFASYGVDMAECEVGMVQTICRRLGRIIPPSLIITDENHHGLATSYRKIYDYFPAAYCVGLTATPVRLNGGGLGDINDILITGPTVTELINDHRLAPFKYYAPAVADLSGLKPKRGGDYSTKDIDAALDKPKIYGDVISCYNRLGGGKQAICYCASINSSQKMAAEFTAHGISAAHIDGDTPKAERAAIVDKFRTGDIQILCNVDLISEGFDVPDCGVSILLRPTKSLTLYIQQAMRCMRYKPNKEAVIIDHVGNVHRFGLPDQEFEWSLDPAPKREKRKSSDDVVTAEEIRQCPKCYAAHKWAKICPQCGFVYPIQERKIETNDAAELVEITETVKHYTRPADCKTRRELAIYGKLKGYKPGWVYYAAKELNINGRAYNTKSN